MENLTLTEQTTTFRYDFQKIFFKSDRMYANKISDNWVLYNPDFKGYPIVVNNDTYNLLQYFTDGKSVGECLVSFSDSNLSFEDKVTLLAFLEKKGYIRNQKTASRYSANELTTFQPNSIGIWLHINNHCNLDCEYCFVDKFKSEMSYETIDKTIGYIVNTAKFRELESIDLKFAGGEPTLSQKKMEYFHDKLLGELDKIGVKLFTSVLSNGTVLNERLISFLKRPNVGIGISLDGYGAESHDIYRVYKNSRKGSWSKIMKTFDEFKKHDIVPYIMATISEDSCKTLPELVKWIFKNGYRTRLSVVRQPNNIWDSSIGGEKAYKVLTDTMIDSFELAFTELEKEEYSFDVRNSLHICELQFEHPSFTACCGIGSNHIVIQDDGKLASCPMTIRETNIQPSDDLISSASKTFTHSPTMRNESEEKNCLDCQWVPVCVSGCPVTNERMKGKPFTISPLHDYYTYVIPRYVNFFAKKLLQSNQCKPFYILDSENISSNNNSHN